MRSTPYRPHQLLSPFGLSSYYRIFVQENSSIYHLYSQTESMLLGELCAALLHKGKTTQAV